MLKIKDSSLHGKKKSEAYKEIQKEDNTKPLYSKVPEKLFYKLKQELLEERKTYTEWLIEKIKEI